MSGKAGNKREAPNNFRTPVKLPAPSLRGAVPASAVLAEATPASAAGATPASAAAYSPNAGAGGVPASAEVYYLNAGRSHGTPASAAFVSPEAGAGGAGGAGAGAGAEATPVSGAGSTPFTPHSAANQESFYRTPSPGGADPLLYHTPGQTPPGHTPEGYRIPEPQTAAELRALFYAPRPPGVAGMYHVPAHLLGELGRLQDPPRGGRRGRSRKHKKSHKKHRKTRRRKVHFDRI